MTATGSLRIRQATIVARDLDSVVADLRSKLPLGEPFYDPDVEQFGLCNAVLPLGDTFVEVISPVEEGTAGGRHLDRLEGDGAYMAMFQVDDIDAARARIDELGLRVIFDNDEHGDIDIHIHPKDVPGAIITLDRMVAPESWRWAGPDWIQKAPPTLGPGRVTGATVGAVDPSALADTWAAALGTRAVDDRITLDGGELRFVARDRDNIVEFHVEGLEADVVSGGVTFLSV